ncbi:hypothetical protein EV421DRAFT_1802134 [Armillaria borealis]|uniref:Secreted protein n=1 Tax=Armillaria borealis TaxID=47425 RepID=A0AA39JLF9_9AGAR|nr:hypothetical protein EV421DRAFT_1802134 [Armillaria borealis]
MRFSMLLRWNLVVTVASRRLVMVTRRRPGHAPTTGFAASSGTSSSSSPKGDHWNPSKPHGVLGNSFRHIFLTIQTLSTQSLTIENRLSTFLSGWPCGTFDTVYPRNFSKTHCPSLTSMLPCLFNAM